MPSKIKAFNFNGCSHLRKIVIGNEVELNLKAGVKIDLSDTPITAKNDILKVNVIDPEKEATATTFKDAPEGITSDREILKKIRLKTAEPMEVQTDPITIHIEGVSLSEWDKRAIERMRGSLFWFDTLKEKGKREYLEQRRDELKVYISNNPAKDNLNDNVRVLGENILLVAEKILENADLFNDLDHFETLPDYKKPEWYSFHAFLTVELLEQDGLFFKFRQHKDIKEEVRNGLIIALALPSTYHNNLTEYFNATISAKALERFMNVLEATLDKDGSKYYTFPNYDSNWKFEDYYNNDTKYIGLKPYTTDATTFPQKSLGANEEKLLKNLFEYWQTVYLVQEQFGKLKDKEKRISKLEQDLKKVEGEKAKLEVEKNQALGIKETAERELNELRSKERELEMSKNRVSELEQSIQSINQQKNQLQQEKNNLQTQKNSAESELVILRANQSTYDAQSKKVRELESKISAYYIKDQQINNLNNQVSSLNSQLTTAKSNATNWQTNYNNVQTRIRTLEAQVSNYNTLQTNYNNAQSQINSLNAQLTTEKANGVNWKQQINSLNSQVSSLNGQISNLQSKNIDNKTKTKIWYCHSGSPGIIKVYGHSTSPGNYSTIKFDFDSYEDWILKKEDLKDAYGYSKVNTIQMSDFRKAIAVVIEDKGYIFREENCPK